jgi:hypothetical protein
VQIQWTFTSEKLYNHLVHKISARYFQQFYL